MDKESNPLRCMFIFSFVLLNSFQDSRSISTKVKYSVTEQLELDNWSIHLFLGVIWGRILFDI
jgi:hypothetical protein